MHLMLDRREYQTTNTRSVRGQVEELLAWHYLQLLCSDLAIYDNKNRFGITHVCLCMRPLRAPQGYSV